MNEEKEIKRILIKLSGEALSKGNGEGYDNEVIQNIAVQVREIVAKGIKVGIVIGGGNYWRGRSSKGIDRYKADQIGMLATVMNCIYVSEVFKANQVKATVLTSFKVGEFTEVFSKELVEWYFAKNTVVLFGGGIGNPYFSTDTGTVLRAVEIEADLILMAKSIDGVYDSDPAHNPEAKRFDEITLTQMLEQKLEVIDLTSSVLALNNKMPMLVFKLDEPGAILDAASGITIGTKIIPE